MKNILLALFLLLPSLVLADTVTIPTTYATNGTVTSTNLNGNFQALAGKMNGFLDNDNANTTSGYRFYKVVSSLPSSGIQGAMYFQTSDNTLYIDTGSSFVSAGSGGGGGGGTWGSITGTLSSQTDLQAALDAKVPVTRTVNGHALSANVTVSPSDLGLVIGTNVQAYDADLTTYAGITPSSNVQSVLSAASFSAIKALLSLNNVENTALSTWAGSTNITTVGTVTSGTWQGTSIADAYISSSSTWNAKQSAISAAQTGVIYKAASGITTDVSNFYYDDSAKALHVGSVITAATNAPQVDFYPAQSSDTHFIAGVNADGQNDNDDNWYLSEGTVLGSSNRITAAPGGAVTIPNLFASTVTVSAGNFVTDTTTGSQIATASTQKLGFWGSTPTVRPSGNICTAMSSIGLVTGCTESGSGSGGPTYWQKTLLPQGAVADDSNPPDFSVQESTGTGTPRRLTADFDATTDQILYWSFVVPTDMAAGDWLLDISWFANSTTANADAIWAAQVSCTSEGDADSIAEDATGSANTASENVSTTEANRLVQTTLTLSNLDSAAAGDFCTVRFFRDADDSVGDADNDGLSVDARLLGINLRIPRS